MGAEDWIKGLNRLRTRDIPITFSGGEPTLHPKFFDIMNEVRKPMDLLTNGEFSVTRFMKRFSPDKFKREAPYASIRFSYHPEQMKIMELLGSVIRLQEEGYSVGVWAVGNTIKNRLVQLLARFMGIDFRIKELLDKKHGHYKYPEAVNGYPKQCRCKPSELLIAPDGRLFRCHFELYHGLNSYGHILDNNIKLPTDFAPCENMGLCSPCDVKIKNSRHQVWGHCSVEING
jgi:sulfatase maturation enzyme AslB (radical SAM superfamily)